MTDLLKQARHYTPGGVHSPVRACQHMGLDPLFFTHGQGPYIFDHEGHRYIDYVCGFGPVILGHAHPALSKVLSAQAQRGLVYGGCDANAPILSKMLCDALPGVDQIRLMNSGTEACMTAVRLARAATGRSKVIKFEGAYHGHYDAFLVAAGSGALNTVATSGVTPGAVQDTLLLPFNDVEAVRKTLEQHAGTVAAIILEPIAGNMGMILPMRDYLSTLRHLCDAHGVVLIFDEVMTGFRVAYGGAGVHYGVIPDLTVLGKVIGGGLPIGAVAGSRDLMELLAPSGAVYQAGTFSANPMSLCAGIETLKHLSDTKAYQHLSEHSHALSEGLVLSAAQQGIDLQGVSLGGMLGVFFSSTPVQDLTAAQQTDPLAFKWFYQGMRQAGIVWPPSPYEAFFIGTQHDEDTLKFTLAAADQVFQSCAQQREAQ